MIDVAGALELLSSDSAKNISFINFIKNNKVTFLQVVDNAIVGKGISDHEWVYFCCHNEMELIELLKFCKSDKFFAVLEDWMLPFVAEEKEIDWKLSTRRYILPENIEFVSTIQRVEDLQATDADYIYQNSKYKDFLSVKYIEDRINMGLSSGIKENGKLVAWAITQDDGAIGFLNVLQEYRRQGYAIEIIVDIINKVRKSGNIPFAYIEDTNKHAVELCNKLGFLSDRLIHWIKLV